MKCDENLTERHNKLVNGTIDSLDSLQESNLLTEKEKTMLKTSHPKTPKFYRQPKIHKEGKPGRPVISSIDCHTAKISKYVDFHLQDMSQKRHLTSKTQ